MPSRPLTSSPALWRLQFGHYSEADVANQATRRRILARDGNRCMDCSVVLSRHMEVRHLDDDHDNHTDSNLACVCPFCHMRDHLGATGFASAALVIGHTQLDQAMVNTLTMGIWYIQDRITTTPDIRQLPGAEENPEEAWRQRLRSNADTLMAELQTKCVRYSAAFSPQLTEPDVLGGVLNELLRTSPESYAKRDTLLTGLHLLPLREAFATQCPDWFAEFDRTRPLTSWIKGLETFMTRIGTTTDDFYSEVGQALRSTSKSPSALMRPMGVPQSPAPPAAQQPGDDASDADAPRAIGNRYSD